MRRILVASLCFVIILSGVCRAGVTESETVSGQQQDAAKSQVQELQEKILSDGEVMNLVNVLQNDPEIQAVLNDPSVLQAILSIDINSLKNNPRFRKLLDNPRMKDIMQRLNKPDSK
jgi:hypothetical protein